jgi:TRAP-type transport system periplasmic protein
MRSPTRAAVGLGFAAILAGAACSPPPASPQSTEPQQTRILRIATDDEPGRPAADQIEEFARQVKELSGGTLLIEPLWKAVGEDKDDWDQAVARGVMAGDFDMGLVPARAWDTEGVDSFAALHAPFLVTNNALLAKVIEPGVADEMLSGLDKLGVAGLALFPESTRTLFAFGNPVLKPADLAGKTIRAPRSDTTYALLTALGASPDDLAGEVFPDGVATRQVVAAESSFAAASDLPAPTTAAANLVLYPKVSSLIANSKVFQNLSEPQRQQLTEAATATRTWAVRAMKSVADDAAEFCRNGGTVIMATEAEVTAFKDAGAAVYSKLEADPATKAHLTKIRDLAAATASVPSEIQTCSPGQ